MSCNFWTLSFAFLFGFWQRESAAFVSNSKSCLANRCEYDYYRSSQEIKAIPLGPEPDLIREVEDLTTKYQLKDKLSYELQQGAPTKLPFSSKDIGKTTSPAIFVPNDRLAMAKNSIRALSIYTDEIECYLMGRKWEFLEGFLGVFAEQENAIIDLIDGLYPTESLPDRSCREAMEYEAQKMFMALDELRMAAKMKRYKMSRLAYVNLVTAYDRFLKAGDLYPAYDPITSTEPFFKGISMDALQYDKNGELKIMDPILIVDGPDKGKTGRLLHIDDDTGGTVVKLDTNGRYREVKQVPKADVMRQKG